MRKTSSPRAIRAILFSVALALLLAPFAAAQQDDGPQTDAPPAVTPPPPPAPAPSASTEKVVVPAGTRLGVILESGISTRSAKAGDSVYLRTSFPITESNKVVIPVGSYLRGEILESKRPGHVKGKGELRLRLDTLILPNGYTVNLNAAPRSADTGGRETMDPEGKISSGGGKGQDAGTVVRTTAETTGVGTAIGAIAGGAKGAGIGAGIGLATGLATYLFTRGPEAQLPRGSTMDVVLEHALSLDASKIDFKDLGQPSPISPLPVRP
jgi:hypothetical protein